MKVSLTFDNGPHPEVTPLVLDELARRGICATFFVLGARLAEPGGLDLLARVRSEGHSVGNHTYSHSVPLGHVDGAHALEEIRATESLLGNIETKERLFRPFGGRGLIADHLFNEAAWNYLAAQRYTCILWNCLAREWDWPDSWGVPTARDCASRDWSVVVIHDILPEAPRQLSILLDELAKLNAEFSKEFPDDCIVMKRGAQTGYPTQIIATTPSGFAPQSENGA